jgi:hypothetical protein
MPRRPIGDRAMSATERTHRHRQRIRDERAEQQRITERYFDGRPPLSQKERRRLAREMSWLIDTE